MKQYMLPVLLSICVIVLVMAFVQKETGQPGRHLEIVLRNIGHQVLLHSGDSTSRVLPVREVSQNSYRISFENSFGFTADTLMEVIQQQLTATDWPQDYTVSVNDCETQHSVFAYEVSKAHGNLTPCRGRQQQKGCYTIEISFPVKNSFNYGWLLLAFIPVAFAGFSFARRRNGHSQPVQSAAEKPDGSAAGLAMDDHTMVGNFIFSPSRETLSINGETIPLSVKEAKALSLLASGREQVVARDLLMKAIWEEEGVFVITRNVDVLMSKLRKKLSADPGVKIVNVHGKGYKMSISI